MKDYEIKVDDDTSSILEAIAEAEDDPQVLAELAQLDPAEFRQFISECNIEGENAIQLLKAAESLERVGTSHREAQGYRSLLTRLTFPAIIVQRLSPFRLILMLNAGLALSLMYGLLGSGLVWYYTGVSEAQRFFAAYTSLFKTFISLGLILGTWMIVYSTQDIIPETIEAAFNQKELDATYYFINKQKFYSLKRSISFYVEFIVVGFMVFSYCQFPLSPLGQSLMIFAVCAEYGLAAYIGRKLIYSGMMLHSLLGVTLNRNLFRDRELDVVNTYVTVVSTLTLIFICVHVLFYYGGPFLYGSIVGQSIKTFLLLPALIGAPVLLISNFYPRVVLQRLYSQSVEIERSNFIQALEQEELSAFEKRYYLIEFDKMSRYKLLSYSILKLIDIPILITLLIMVQGLLLRQ